MASPASLSISACTGASAILARPYATIRSTGSAPGPSGGFPVRIFFLEFFLGMIEQGKHESCSAAEVTENGAFPNPGAGGDGVHCQRRGRAGLCDQVGRGIE
ncbi:Uncharacterised protein [Mycobacteroides abscessus subsp. abscessus]|nr:Uncharacterised protein [Mycobacteroides abscessus subsp. abscessus]SHY18291.1 Uncharacterised protein [Mycobacteroides abscessus subsp. abscessus]SKG04313.1 Uncharacterised protein [Mycobacteroides abscessus subsp. abscessus]SKG25368.1 Uncharacterised protein [Mycobacteroides abscessus subsp. abscessus]SKG60015.1 Uncharacterised protein [Mycobacteroides abscessus subsp. abscessus]